MFFFTYVFLLIQQVVWTPSKIISRLGKEIQNPESVYYWAYKVSTALTCLWIYHKQFCMHFFLSDSLEHLVHIISNNLYCHMILGVIYIYAFNTTLPLTLTHSHLMQHSCRSHLTHSHLTQHSCHSHLTQHCHSHLTLPFTLNTLQFNTTLYHSHLTHSHLTQLSTTYI